MTAMQYDPADPVFTLGDYLAKARQRAGLSQQDIADRLFVSRTTVINWENGHTHPSDRKMTAWAMATGVRVEWLRSALVSVGSGSTRSVSRGHRTSGWFRRHVAKQRPPVLLAHEHNHPGLSPVSQVTPFPAPRRSPERLPADPYRRAG